MHGGLSKGAAVRALNLKIGLIVADSFAIIAIVAAGLAVQSCSVMCRGLGGIFPGQCKEEKSDAAPLPIEESPPGERAEQPITHGGGDIRIPQPPTEEISEFVPGAGTPLTRITPEQLSLFVQKALGLETTFYNDYLHEKMDYLQLLYGVSLGGIDFVNTAKRDKSTKAQTLLVARVVAWTVTRESVFTDLNRAQNDRKLFTECDMAVDRPVLNSEASLPTSVLMTLQESEFRWKAQVENLYWRFFSRPPRDEEVSAVRQAFLTSYAAENSVPAAWTAVVYALVSVQEFWNI
jgi:hypothetical protein